MMHAKGRYRNQVLELDQPLDIAEGTEVEIDIRLAPEERDAEHQEWIEIGMSRLEQEWNNPDDSVYDDWKKLYGVERW